MAQQRVTEIRQTFDWGIFFGRSELEALFAGTGFRVSNGGGAV